MLFLSRMLVTAGVLMLSAVGSNAQTADRFDIIIVELLPDPAPSTGLPASEFIELKNN